ncbi:TetR/AcrR family transcriptional regulator [Arthrobacter sp. CJ23]|uniref:TetR/AcrR family transcriptional regulator n=1 Tax=Arthrobacter sp. CJ23 TaxID=2972479 RepID=UPI00215D3460|nr:TetR/AcrR family transcriptional regulator [Arthrobacter sp. CJ23]UVJ39408.1 TetR/AcrR family transcriptional regulator [Arthrobacter sp. CJ23]
MVNKPSTPDPGRAVAAALELLVRQGYDATSVDDLAVAAGISRSTFFRKFGSKEDMVFADHDRILARVEDQLSRPAQDPLAAVADAALLVFEHHVRNRGTSLTRHELLHQVPALRDRELVMTHRYQRAFRRYLQYALPEGPGSEPGTREASGAGEYGAREYGAVAYAASVVAVHNSVLRMWLGEAAAGSPPELDRELAARLGRELRALADTFRPVLGGAPLSGAAMSGSAASAGRPAVVVAVLDPAAGTEQILQAVREALA